MLILFKPSSKNDHMSVVYYKVQSLQNKFNIQVLIKLISSWTSIFSLFIYAFKLGTSKSYFQLQT